jgi:hypothetical protein
VSYFSFLHDQSKLSSQSFSSTTFQNFQSISDLFSKFFPVSAPYKAVLQVKHFISFFLKCQCNLLVERFFFLNDAFVTVIHDSLSVVHLASSIIMLQRQLKYSTFSSFFSDHNLYWGFVLEFSSSRYLCLSDSYPLDLSSLGDITGNNAATGFALKVSGKPLLPWQGGGG